MPIADEMLTNCILGGMVMGAAGGLDVVGLWLVKRGSKYGVGRFSFLCNVVVYGICAWLFGVRTAVYSIICMAVYSLFVDRMHQQNINMQALIFTHGKEKELAASIMEKLGRGVTYWEGKGAYTGNDICILCACVSKFEEADLRKMVGEIDPGAFLVIQEGVAISGNFEHRLAG